MTDTIFFKTIENTLKANLAKFQPRMISLGIVETKQAGLSAHSRFDRYGIRAVEINWRQKFDQMLTLGFGKVDLEALLAPVNTGTPNTVLRVALINYAFDNIIGQIDFIEELQGSVLLKQYAVMQYEIVHNEQKFHSLEVSSDWDCMPGLFCSTIYDINSNVAAFISERIAPYQNKE